MANNIKHILATFGPLWCEIVLEGFKHYQNAYSRESADHSKTSRASLIHDHMMAKAKMLLPSPFNFTRYAQRGVFTFADEVVIQFKRLGTDMMPRNFPTPTTKTLYGEGAIEGLPGIPANIPFLTIGYVPDEFWRHPLGVFVTQIISFSPSWVHRLDGVSEFQPELPIPIHNHVDKHRQTKARLKASDLPERRDAAPGGSEEARAG